MSKPKFNRAEHCRRIAASGGRSTYQKHGSAHMSQIGVKGFRATAEHFRYVTDYKHFLSSLGAYIGWKQSGLPDTGKFPSERPLGPWDENYTEF